LEVAPSAKGAREPLEVARYLAGVCVRGRLRHCSKLAWLIGVAAETACDDPPRQPASFLAELELTELVDENPAPDVVEVSLEARVVPLEILPGLTSEVWTYGGVAAPYVGGPLLRAKPGDRLIVHFKNSLPEPTTVHWHGVRLHADMDGVPHHSQPPIEPGNTFDYDFVVPDAGLFWYHPHHHDAAQLGFGLYGALIVEHDDERDALGDEVVLVLSDVGLDEETGQLFDPEAGGAVATVFGREGNFVLVNGRVRPTMHAHRGLSQRWRIVNAARSRFFQLALAGHSFRVVGGQAGRVEPYDVAEPVLSPGERLDVLVTPTGAEGEVLTLEWVPFDRGYGSTEFREREPVLDVALEGALPAGEPVVVPDAPVVEPLSPEGATVVDVVMTLDQDEQGAVWFGFDGVPFPEGAPIPATVGETQLWRVKNDTPWDHPFHLHGFFFQPTHEDGSPLARVEWLDTFNVPREESRAFLVRYDNRPGAWMFHCHILDHADAGMMSFVDLAP
jgi:FtsP/CotA-like multicopper oxidase with cupredoxin domain